MHLNKKFLAPLFSLAAFFGAASARAQDLPEAPKPQNDAPVIFTLTPAQQAAIEASVQRPKLNLQPYDTQWMVAPPSDADKFQLNGKLGKAVDFADRHSAEGVQGFDLAAQAKVSSRFTIIAGTPDTSLRNNSLFAGPQQSWKPEINLYSDTSTRITMKPKRGGVAIGIRFQFH